MVRIEGGSLFKKSNKCKAFETLPTYVPKLVTYRPFNKFSSFKMIRTKIHFVFETPVHRTGTDSTLGSKTFM